MSISRRMAESLIHPQLVRDARPAWHRAVVAGIAWGPLLQWPRLHSFMLLWGVFLALLFPVPSMAAPDAVRIGEINPLTGKLAMHGQEIHQGILYAVEEVNARGGLCGRMVELISRDDQSQPEVAINQTQELLLRERIIGLVGGYVDSMVGPISEITAKQRVPYVASASLQRALTRERSNPYFFRVARLDGITAPLCQFIVNSLRPKRVGIVYAATPGSTEFGADLRSCLESAGISVPLFEKFRSGSTDFSAFLLKFQQAPVDILVSGGFYPDHLVLVRQLREQNTPLQAYIAPWGVAYQSFIREMGEASEQIFGTCAWNPGITLPGSEAQSQAFVQGFQQRFGQLPNTTTMHGYASARALLVGIERALAKQQPLTGEAIRQELSSLDLLLPMEHLQFDQKGDPRYYRHVIVQIQQGQMEVVYPPERATSEMVFPMK
jgi:branched-chain amino acid transport system substrate-binding protein